MDGGLIQAPGAGIKAGVDRCFPPLL